MAHIENPQTPTEIAYNEAVRLTEDFIRRGDTSSPEFQQARHDRLVLSKRVVMRNDTAIMGDPDNPLNATWRPAPPPPAPRGAAVTIHEGARMQPVGVNHVVTAEVRLDGYVVPAARSDEAPPAGIVIVEVALPNRPRFLVAWGDITQRADG